MPRYFARVTAGTESIAIRELKGLSGLHEVETANRRLNFVTTARPPELLMVRSVDDVYVWVGEIEDIGKHRSTLADITRGVSHLLFDEAIEACRRARDIPDIPSFTITASLSGNRNYNRFEVEASVAPALPGWRYIPNQPEHAPVDLDIRVIIEDETSLIGVRLGDTPLHRRRYKRYSTPGSLKPPVAYCMCLLADLQPGTILLDPMCGAGTIPLEAAIPFSVRALGMDISAEAVAAAQANKHEAATWARAAHFSRADAQMLPLADEAVDRIVCNLPWGKQILSEGEIGALYARALPEFRRVLHLSGRIVLLTDRADLLLPAMREFEIVEQYPISLYGLHPTIFVLRSR
jgi:tRNA (guanine6-N2)-methyltransferase